jgi:hypothetical protein
MTFAEMQERVSRRLGEGSSRVFWTLADVKEAINGGYMELSDQTEWREQYLEIDLLNSRPWYDLQSIVGDNLLSLRPAFNEDTNWWLRMTTVRTLDSGDRRWERVTGQPQRMLRRGWRWLGLWPRMPGDSGTAKVYYTALPDPLVEDDDEPGFPGQFHMGCVDWAVSDLWAQDGEATFAEIAWQAYIDAEKALGAWIQHRAGDPWRPAAGAGITGLP